MAEMKRIAMITGSFDPVTSGHTDLIRRAAKMFDFVYVALMSNGEKDFSGGGMFTYSQRLSMLEAACADLVSEGITNVKAELCEGLSSAYAAERGITYIVRGVRCASDFDYEYSLASIMKRFDSNMETVMLPSEPSIACVSSTYVRELIKYGHPIGDAMPASAATLAVEYYGKR